MEAFAASMVDSIPAKVSSPVRSQRNPTESDDGIARRVFGRRSGLCQAFPHGSLLCANKLLDSAEKISGVDRLGEVSNTARLKRRRAILRGVKPRHGDNRNAACVLVGLQ